MKEMCRKIPMDACPVCGHRYFAIRDADVNTFITDRDGKIHKFKSEERMIAGLCLTCHNMFEMYPAYDSYIPITPIRKFLREFQPTVLDKTNNIDYTYIENPIQIADEEKY